MGEAAAAVDIPEFKVKQGVKIETDPNATSSAPSSAIDDDGVIDSLIGKLQASAHDTLFYIFPVAPLCKCTCTTSCANGTAIPLTLVLPAGCA